MLGKISVDMSVCVRNTLALLLILSFWACQGEKCITGSFHRNHSGSGSNFFECLNYKDNACCTSDFTKIVKNTPELLYNFTWHHCDAVSKPCQRYLINEECFFQCDPVLIRYQRQGAPYAVSNVPICSDYCDKWFDACKDDKTCVEDWESDFVKIDNRYECPAASKCKTFKEVYKNGTGLCNKMWGQSFTYKMGGKDCFVMGPHHKYTSKAFSICQKMPVTLFMGVILAFGFNAVFK